MQVQLLGPICDLLKCVLQRDACAEHPHGCRACPASAARGASGCEQQASACICPASSYLLCTVLLHLSLPAFSVHHPTPRNLPFLGELVLSSCFMVSIFILLPCSEVLLCHAPACQQQAEVLNRGGVRRFATTWVLLWLFIA